jgi:hypothetical protein
VYSTLSLSLSLPLVVDEDVLGAMDLYSRVERAFRQADREAGCSSRLWRRSC